MSKLFQFFIKSAGTLSLAGTLVGIALVVLVFSLTVAPDISILTDVKTVESVQVQDKNGKLLFDFSENIQRKKVPFREMSKHIISAVIAVEDNTFYEHGGISIRSILRSIFVDITSLSFKQGGSTITQQLVKNVFLPADKKIIRKIKEIVLAIKLEKTLSKQEIVEAYLNTVPFGGTLYGIESAANTFFNKKAIDLTAAESAYAASLLKAPTYYSPYGNHKDELVMRKDVALDRMYSLGFLTNQEYQEAKSEDVVFEDKIKFLIRAPHFVFFVRELLEQQNRSSLDQFFGEKITTTIDLEFQNKVQELATDFSREFEKTRGAENVSVVVLEAKTGKILSMVGSRGYFDQTIDGEVNASTSRRQPGSSFKPFVYAKAFEKGLNKNTILFDVETQFGSGCEPDILESNDEGCYSPKNFSKEEHGPVPIRIALARSYNIPAIKTLYLAGLVDVIDLVKKLGITTLTESPFHYGLSLVLGSGEVTLLEMANAYATFANDGVFVKYSAVESVSGRINEQPRGVRVLSKETAREINSILSDDNNRTPSLQKLTHLYYPDRDVAAKTGTTSDSKDLWLLGYSPEIVVGVWAGNNDATATTGNSTGLHLAPLWRSVMDLAIAEYGGVNRFFGRNTTPENTDAPEVVNGNWAQGIRTENGVAIPHSILNSVSVPLSFKAEDEEDPQFIRWEKAIERWAKTDEGRSNIFSSLSSLINTGQLREKESIKIRTPSERSVIKAGKNLNIQIETNGFNFLSFDIYVNNNLITSSRRNKLVIPSSSIPFLEGENILKVVGNTTNGNFVVREVEIIYAPNPF